MTLNYHLTVLSYSFILSGDVIKDSLGVLNETDFFFTSGFAFHFLSTCISLILQLSIGHYYNRRIILQI